MAKVTVNTKTRVGEEVIPDAVQEEKEEVVKDVVEEVAPVAPVVTPVPVVSVVDTPATVPVMEVPKPRLLEKVMPKVTTRMYIGDGFHEFKEGKGELVHPNLAVLLRERGVVY